MQWSQIWGEVASNFPTANQGRVQLACQAAYHEFMSARQWSFGETRVASIALTAGQTTYVLAGASPVVPDFNGMIDVMLEMTTGGQKEPLFELLQGDFDRVFNQSATNSEPVAYCLRGSTPQASSAAIISGGSQVIQLGPPPVVTAGHGQALSLSYYRSLGSVEMTANTDVPILPAQYHYSLVIGGNAYIAEAIGNLQKAGMFRQLFQQRIQEAMVTDQGLRGRDRQLLVFQPGASVYPITGQTQATFDPATRPYDLRS